MRNKAVDRPSRSHTCQLRDNCEIAADATGGTDLAWLIDDELCFDLSRALGAPMSEQAEGAAVSAADGGKRAAGC
jgi:hypothetical protein